MPPEKFGKQPTNQILDSSNSKGWLEGKLLLGYRMMVTTLNMPQGFDGRFSPRVEKLGVRKDKE